jgi:hypothetical protein
MLLIDDFNLYAQQAASTRPYTDAKLLLARPGLLGSISYSKTITVDTSVPTVQKVTVTSADGVYATGDVIKISVYFTQPVVFTGQNVSPSLLLQAQTLPRIGGQYGERRATYASGNGTTVLKLEYTVQLGDHTTLLVS